MKLTIALVLTLIWAATLPAITIDTVPVGNPGNLADTRYIDSSHPNGVGSVMHLFNIGKTEVTNTQYLTMLNAVAGTDPYGLFNASMTSDTWGGIIRSGSPGSYVYSIKTPIGDYYSWENKAVVDVDWGDAARFANWLNNGQPTGTETSSTTEDGAYTMNGATTDTALTFKTRNPGARWFIPTEDEWYKPAYHKNDGVTGNYWDFPTHTNSIPNNNLPSSDTGNSADFWSPKPLINGYTTGSYAYPMTDAGAYLLSGSSYGTFDQGGNADEWNETLFSGLYRGDRGGSWNSPSNGLKPPYWAAQFPTITSGAIGFRVASIPEPSAVLLAAVIGVAACCLRKQY